MWTTVTWGCQTGIFRTIATSPAICQLMHKRNSAWWRGGEWKKGKRKESEKVEGGKNCLGCKMGPFINNNGSGCIPTGGGDSWNFQISEGPSKAAETGYSVSPDPIREQWSMRPAKKRPERERSYLMLLVTRPAITCREPLPLVCCYVIIKTRCYPCWSHWLLSRTQMPDAPSVVPLLARS